MENGILDIAFHESGDGGDINLRAGDIDIVKGLFNQCYLALFGGNIEQNTELSLQGKSDRQDWWGNEYLNQEQQFNSNFERTISEVTLTSGGIAKLVTAAKKDLQYLSDYADVDIQGSIPQLNRFQLLITLTQPGRDSIKIKYIWDGVKRELIEQTYV